MSRPWRPVVRTCIWALVRGDPPAPMGNPHPWEGLEHEGDVLSHARDTNLCGINKPHAQTTTRMRSRTYTSCVCEKAYLCR